MPQKPTYKELEKRIAELEQKIACCQEDGQVGPAQFKPLSTDVESHLLPAIINNTNNVVQVKNRMGRYILVNQRYCDILKIDKNDILGKTVFDIYPHDLAAEFDANDHKVIEEQKALTFQERPLLPDGYHDFITIKSPIFDDTGRVIAVCGISTDITDRVKKASRQMFQNIVNGSPMGIHLYELHQDGRLVFSGANPASDKILGVRHQQFMGKTIEGAFPPLSQTEVPARYRDAAREGIVWRTEQIDYDEGAIKGAFEVVAFQTEPFKMAAFFNDITARKKVELALKQSEEKMRSIFAAAPVGIGLVVNRFLLEVNERLCEMTGYAKDDLIGKNARILYPDDNDYEYVGTEKYRQIKEFGTGTVETRFLRKDGQIINVLMSSTPLDPANLEAGVSFTALDITASKQGQEALRESEQRFRHLTEMLPEAVFESDQDLTLTYGNRRAFELFGYDPEELHQLNGLYLIAPEDRQRLLENQVRQLEGQELGPIEYNAVKKDGSIFPILLHATVIEKQNQYVGFRGIAIDLTEQKKAEQEKRQVEFQYRQAQKVEAVGRLAGGVAHDLNNLLSPILGYSELLEDKFSPQDSRREFIEQIIKASYGARDMVRQLLAFSRKQTLEYRLLNLNQILTGFEKLLRRTIREDIELQLILSPDIQDINADAGQIEQVIMNLSVNSQDAMPQGGQLILQTATAELDEAAAAQRPDATAGRYVLLAVSDTGCGMDAETQEHLFEPFYSTKGDQGTGLGMATVYGIVKQHGGNIWVYSEPDKGTTFKIYLPAAESATVQKADKQITTDELKGSETILLVEDNELVRRLAYEILKHQGYTLLTAKSAVQAMDVLVTHCESVDLLLTDVVMPDMNGKQLYEEIVKQCPGLKVLYMSGYTGDVIAHRGVLDKGVQFIQKPFTVHGLATKVREVLQHK